MIDKGYPLNLKSIHLFISAIAASLSEPFLTLTCHSFGSLIDGNFLLY